MRRRLTGLALLLTSALSTAQPGAQEAVFRPILLATGELWQNLRGGVGLGGSWNTLVDLKGELAGEALDLPTGSLVVGQVRWVANRAGRNAFGAKTGAFNAVSGIVAEDHVRVFNFYYLQRVAGGRWAFKGGQIAVDDDFMLSDFAVLFANAAFGAMPSQTATPLSSDHAARTAFAIFDVAVPGLWVQYTPGDDVAWQSAIYYGAPGPDTRTNHGFDWAAASGGGVSVFSELARRQEVSGHAMTSRLGIAFHSGTFDDLAAARVGVETRARGLFSVYTVQDLMLVADAAGRPRVGAFGRIGLSPQQDRTAVTWYGDAGVVCYGPLVSRIGDALGVAVSTTHFGRHFRAQGDFAAAETTVEVTYRAQLTQRAVVQFDVQTHFNPARDPASGRRHTAVVFGMRTVMTF